MNDTLAVKDLSFAALTGTQFPGSARNFARVVGSNDASQHLRLSNHVNVNGLSPTTLRVSHQPRKSGSGVQRSVFSIDQDLTRLDSSSNPVSKTRVSVKFQADIPQDVTLAEYQAAVALLFGALSENSGALITAVFNAEF